MLSNSIQISNEELVASRDPSLLVYTMLLDAGCPVSANGSMSPSVEGFSSWTVDGTYLCLSWGDKEVADANA